MVIGMRLDILLPQQLPSHAFGSQFCLNGGEVGLCNQLRTLMHAPRLQLCGKLGIGQVCRHRPTQARRLRSREVLGDNAGGEPEAQSNLTNGELRAVS